MSNNDEFSRKLLEMFIACQNEIVAITADEVKATNSGDAFVKGSDLSDALSRFIQERFPNLDEEHIYLSKIIGLERKLHKSNQNFRIKRNSLSEVNECDNISLSFESKLIILLWLIVA